MERIEYLGLPNCYRLDNGQVELVVSTDVGPRILRYGLIGGQNMLGETPNDVIKSEFGDFKPWGGHRLWVAPEANPRSYWPDNVPVEARVLGDNKLSLIAPIEPGTGVQKALEITLESDGSQVEIVHQISNHNLWDIELSPWALTIMNGGGIAILPQEPYRSWEEYLLPARPLILWHYTNLTDPRLRLGERIIQIRTAEDAGTPVKLGVLNKQGWAAYYLNDQLFVKRSQYVEGAQYPDYNSNFEIYTKASFIELETLGPLTRLGPGATVSHTETWQLLRDVLDLSDEKSASNTLERLVKS